ncbi:hypothetical protein [Parasulfitobacter algicola]|uniref:Uncharacterized protein n=1 Tax=Parasulfitobacter algicola TaxID=2614809 RepID=A0ABX2IUB3_9RHOB|nr:hypothetical protein [Sulfitobacter algicola]NSX55910.1 hypothetical protein [Sulfitobacter algicola]
MNKAVAITGVIAVVAVAAVAFYMVDIDQTEEARLPDVSIDIEGGQIPEYEAEVGSISVGETTVEVEVPEVQVTTNTEEVTIPTLNVSPPSND